MTNMTVYYVQMVSILCGNLNQPKFSRKFSAERNSVYSFDTGWINKKEVISMLTNKALFKNIAYACCRF